MITNSTINQSQKLITECLHEIDTSKLDEIIQKFGNKAVISYADLSKILHCNTTEMAVHALANFLYFTLLYVPYKAPLSLSRGSRNLLSPNRIKNCAKWTNALITKDGRHKSFIGRVAFSMNNRYTCHPTSTSQKKAYVAEDEFKIATQGMYGPVRIFYSFLKQKKTKIFIPKKRASVETHVEKLEKLRFLNLTERELNVKGHIYDLEKFQRHFQSCDSLNKFRQMFSRFAIRNDFQLQRVILTLYFLGKKGRPYALLPCSVRRVKKGVKILSTKKPYSLSLYANLGPKTMDSIIEFTHFAGLDYFYFPPTVRKPSGKICLFLACQVSTLLDLLQLLHQNSEEERDRDKASVIPHYKNDVDLKKAKVQVNYLKDLLVPESDVVKRIEEIDKFLEQNGVGCLIDLNLPLENFNPCLSNIFVLTMIQPSSEKFVEEIDSILARQENKTLYYPHFRFLCCYTHGWHRHQFDNMFARYLDALRRKYIWRFYAVGRPGDVSHNISPEVVKAAGQVFDHFKVIKR